jgi:hypothetical protein
MVGVEEAEEFDKFVMVNVEGSEISDRDMEFLQEQLVEVFPDKKILIFDKALDIAIYGVREVEELEIGKE